MSPDDTEITLRGAGTALVTTPSEEAGVKELIDSAKASATKRAYAADFKTFAAWCAGRKEGAVDPLPLNPAIVAIYLKYLYDEGLKVKTIERALAGIVFTHRAQGFSWRTPEGIAEEMNGIRRKRAEAGEKVTKKAAITREILVSMVAKLGVDLVGLRNRAILTLTWAGCSRRSEIAGLDVADLAFVPEGLVITPRKTKTDQEGRDTEKGIPYASEAALCAVRATRAWLTAASITDGPVFRSIAWGEIGKTRLTDQSIAHIVKKTVKSAGFDPKIFSGHSLRAGFITSAVQADVPESEIASQSGHKSVAVLRGYVRHANLFKKNAAKGLL